MPEIVYLVFLKSFCVNSKRYTKVLVPLVMKFFYIPFYDNKTVSSLVLYLLVPITKNIFFLLYRRPFDSSEKKATI